MLEGIVGTLPTSAKIKILAFNRHIVQRLVTKGRLPKNRVSVSTLHGAALGLLQQFFRGAATIDERKSFEISKTIYEKVLLEACSRYIHLKNKGSHQELIAEFPVIPPFFDESDRLQKLILRRYLSFIDDLFGFTQITLTEPTFEAITEMAAHFCLQFAGWLSVLPDDATEEQVNLAKKKDQRCQHWAFLLIPYCLQLAEKIASEQSRLTFNDCLWLCHKWKLRPAKYQYVLVDEAQDLNPSQIALVKSYYSLGARVIFCGDRRQAIQGFQGSYINVWEQIQNQFKCDELPLLISHRCAKSIIKLAQKVVPAIEEDPTQIEGKIAVVNHKTLLSNLKNGDLLICRFNAPLFSWCLAALRAGYAATIRGRDLGKSLISLAKNYLEQPSDWPNIWWHRFNELIRAEYKQLEDTNQKRKAEALQDRYWCISYCFNEFGSSCKSFDSFTLKILNLFNDEAREQIIFSSIHRSKGDEGERVFILNAESLPYTDKAQKSCWFVFFDEGNRSNFF